MQCKHMRSETQRALSLKRPSQLRRWLDLFREKIASANYADEMIAQGWDSLDNMIFSADDLMDAMPDSMKQGHANRIARDAEVMLENIGDLVVQVSSPASLPSASAGVGGVFVACCMACARI